MLAAKDASGTLVARLHDPAAAAGDDHVPLVRQHPAEADAFEVHRLIGGGARRTEDGHLLLVPVGGEHQRRVAHLLHGVAQELQIRQVIGVLAGLESREDHLARQRRVVHPACLLQEFIDKQVYFAVCSGKAQLHLEGSLFEFTSLYNSTLAVADKCLI
jgi:hypothetical protein